MIKNSTHAKQKSRILLLKPSKNHKPISCILFISFMVIIIAAFFILFIQKKFALPEVLSMTADSIAIISCLFVVLQLIAFVNDSRLHENRARKEAGLEIAKGYAKDLLTQISFTKNVLRYECETIFTDFDFFNFILSNEFDSFVKSDLQDDKRLQKYSKIFENGSKEIHTDKIFEYANRYGILSFNKDDSPELTNIKFRIILVDTANLLECYAMSINQNVSDSDMLFNSLHQTYLGFVNIIYPYICISNETEEIFYPNVIKLYKNWNNKKKENMKMNANIRAEAKERMNNNKKDGIPL